MRHICRLFISLALVLTAAFCHAMNEDESLLAFKNQVGMNNTYLDSWKNGTDPCKDWYGVTCSGGKVTKLNLTSIGLTGKIPTELGNLVNLQVLDLHTNSLTGDVPSSFINLVNLKAMNLSRNPFGVPFPNVLLKISNLVDFRCGGCQLSGKLPKNIGKLKKLEFLHIPNNSFTEDLPEELYTLTHLSELNLWGNPLQIDLPVHLGFLQNLTFLKMHSCDLTGNLPKEWGANFTKLATLWLNKNSLEGEIPESWSNMKSLSDLKLSDNRLSGQVPSWLESAHLSSTYLSCNFLTGSRPTLPYSTFKSVGDNCYTGEADDREYECDDHQSCNKSAPSPSPSSTSAPPPIKGSGTMVFYTPSIMFITLTSAVLLMMF